MQTTQQSDLDSKPWYQHPMVWMIILLPATVVVASIYTMVLAHQNAPLIITPKVNTEISSPLKSGTERKTDL